MRLHFGQLPRKDGPRKDRQEGLQIPPPHVIEDVLRRKKPEVDRRIQPTVEIDDEESYRRYEEWKKQQDNRKPPEQERGVYEIQF